MEIGNREIASGISGRLFEEALFRVNGAFFFCRYLEPISNSSVRRLHIDMPIIITGITARQTHGNFLVLPLTTI
jgi:hypothetical protein